ncbi:AMP-binding protein [Telluria aromaticivorans]|uniref:AMP-binding protein n=1 Tax=Telluria aromaticivorans TaxID=2725995 RepID=A0A7Y2JVM3_9BURK|nr:AMP-binding protein [Telluria aromaticivorans]NNG21872.1 AMP-binding protein [Telluria aromaticivorans]
MSDLFHHLAHRAPGELAGWRAGSPVLHGELQSRIRAWAALGQRSTATRVALFVEDSLEFAAALVGAWLSGKTVWLGADTLPATCDALSTQVDAFWGQFPPHHEPRQPAAGDDWQGEWAAPAPAFPALVVFTSGSTGAPAPIAKGLSQLTSEIAALEQQFGAPLGDADILATVSHQHIYGLLFRVLWPLAEGRAIHAERHEFPETLAPALAARPCVLLASPAHLKRLPEHLDWQGAGGKLRAVFSSGGMLEQAAGVHASALLGQVPVEVYGSSETGGVAWRRRGEHAGDPWQPLPRVEWRADPEGLLEVRSSHAGPDGWQQLADRVEDCGDGRFMLRGRADRIVKIEEKRVSLDAIEHALVASGLVREVRVLALPGEGRQVLAAFVVLAEQGRALLVEAGKPALNARLRTLLAAGFEAVALPRRWRYLDRLPVNGQGKTTQAQLLALLDGDARPRFPAMRVLEQEPARMLLELTVPADLLYFDGHFSVAPVLPGVVQVDWAIHYGRSYFDLGEGFGGINALKFQQMIRPDQPVQLELVHDSTKGQLNFRYFSDAGPHASGRILLGN